MQRISSLLQKIRQLAENGNSNVIETDLMMDYTRQLYAELIEYRSKIAADKTTPPELVNDQQTTYYTPVTSPINEDRPTIIELTVENPIPSSSSKQDDDEEDEEADIRTIIGINDKYQIISELFGNNKIAYDEMIDQLNTLDTELEALEWLQDNLYFEYSWSEDSEALMILHAILHKFYSSN
ncbi:MAG: hypothetical protein P4L41_01715 [Flavipsychrobacter sp.]|nr:hypothetical protein [Flavipsychrobacter sp.]